MASSDFSTPTGVLTSGDCRFLVTTGTTKPAGGGNFCRVAHSITNAPGVVAAYNNQAGFAPTSSGAEVTAALCRFTSAGADNFSVFLFAALQSTSVLADAYMLGISAGNPAHLELRKGPLSVGLPDEVPLGENMILRRSTSLIELDEWVHLKLEVVVQPFGDVYVNAYRSDLGAHDVTDPLWEEIPGMELDYNDLAVSFIDDTLGINTGSLPLIGGRMGYGVRVDEAARRAGIDHYRALRQTAP